MTVYISPNPGKAMAYGISQRAAQILLTCSPENEPAMKLYRSMGFAETGRRDEDEIELALTL